MQPSTYYQYCCPIILDLKADFIEGFEERKKNWHKAAIDICVGGAISGGDDPLLGLDNPWSLLRISQGILWMCDS